MARYEDTSTPFAEAQFAGVRERKQEEARKQEKFAKKLLLAQTVAKGANELINQRADALEANQAHIKAAYQTHIGRAEKLRELESAINSSGRTAKDYFQNSYYTGLTDQATKEATAQGLALTQQNFTLLRTQAADMATKKAEAFQKAILQANDIPSLEDFKTNWAKHSKLQAPRTIFGTIAKEAVNFFKKETPETLAYKEGKAKDALFKTPLKNEFTEFETIYKTYDALGFDATPILNALDKQDKRRKVKSTQMISTRDYKNAKGGYVPLITTVYTEYEDGGPADTAKLDIQNSELIDNQMVKPEEISKFVDTLQPSVRGDFLKDIEKLNGFVTIDDYIGLVARRAREDAKLTGVEEQVAASAELRKTWANHLTTLVLDEQTMKEYGLTAENGHIVNTPMYEKNVETGELQAKGEYVFILKDQGLDWHSWRDKGFDEADVDIVKDPKTPEGENIRIDVEETKGFTVTDFKFNPADLNNTEDDDDNPLNAFVNVAPNSNGYQALVVPNMSLYFPTNLNVPAVSGTIKRNVKTGQISYSAPSASPLKTVVQTNTNPTPTVKSSNDFNLSDEKFNELVANAKPFSSMPNSNMLSVPKLDQIVRTISTQTLIDKGYLENKTKARLAYNVRKARKNYREDLLQAIKDARETGKQTLTASI
jgi:hypothetical protein